MCQASACDQIIRELLGVRLCLEIGSSMIEFFQKHLLVNMTDLSTLKFPFLHFRFKDRVPICQDRIWRDAFQQASCLDRILISAHAPWQHVQHSPEIKLSGLHLTSAAAWNAFGGMVE